MVCASHISERKSVPSVYKELLMLNYTKQIAQEVNGQYLQRHFLMANKHMQRCSSSLVMREMQIKKTLRNQCIPVRKIKLTPQRQNTR